MAPRLRLRLWFSSRGGLCTHCSVCVAECASFSERAQPQLSLPGRRRSLVFSPSQCLEMDESAATGETDVVKKSTDGDLFLLSGTNVTDGTGRMLVVGVGENSFSGRITMATRSEVAETPLQEKLAVLANQIGSAGLGFAVLLFVVLTVKQVSGCFGWVGGWVDLHCTTWTGSSRRNPRERMCEKWEVERTPIAVVTFFHALLFLPCQAPPSFNVLHASQARSFSCLYFFLQVSVRSVNLSVKVCALLCLRFIIIQRIIIIQT